MLKLVDTIKCGNGTITKERYPRSVSFMELERRNDRRRQTARNLLDDIVAAYSFTAK
jgi:hypothetical protein